MASAFQSGTDVLIDILKMSRERRELITDYVTYLFNGPVDCEARAMRDSLIGQIFHVTFVRRMTSRILLPSPQFIISTLRYDSPGSSIRSNDKTYWNDHDWSKDLYYMITTSLAYSLNKKDRLSGILDDEVERHYKLECHHPEHMKYNSYKMSYEDIFEMAIDRLSRNLQFNNGHINMDEMKKFEPDFAKSSANVTETEAQDMLQFYWKCVNKYKDICEAFFGLEFEPTKEFICQKLKCKDNVILLESSINLMVLDKYFTFHKCL